MNRRKFIKMILSLPVAIPFINYPAREDVGIKPHTPPLPKWKSFIVPAGFDSWKVPNEQTIITKYPLNSYHNIVVNSAPFDIEVLRKAVNDTIKLNFGSCKNDIS